MNINNTVRSLVEAISIKYNNLVYEMKASGEDVIVLSLGEAFFDIPRFDFNALPFPDLYHYSHSRGILSLRRKIGSYYQTQYGVLCDPEREILITAGSKIGVYYALQSILDDGDEVLLLEPYWVSYTEQVKLVGAIPKSVPIGIEIHDLERFITSKTKALILNNPQNPTGKNYGRRELEHIFELAKRFEFSIISDEAYSDFMSDGDVFVSMGSIDTEFEKTMIVNSISKNFGISGWRIGYLIGNVEIVDAALKLTQHTMTCAPTPLLMYLDRYFEDIIQTTKPQIDLLLKKRARISRSITDIGLKVERGDSTFYFFVNISPSTLDSISFCDRLLNEYKVVAVPGIGYGSTCDQFVRISIGSETEERIIHGLFQIRQLIEATR